MSYVGTPFSAIFGSIIFAIFGSLYDICITLNITIFDKLRHCHFWQFMTSVSKLLFLATYDILFISYDNKSKLKVAIFGNAFSGNL